jgi:hypothetical protein
MAEPTYQHRLRYDPAQVPAGSTVLEHFSGLAVHEKLVTYGSGKNDAWLRYCMYLGEGSGLHTAGLDWADRKKEALRLAGISPTDPRAEKAMAMQDDGVTELRWTWLRVTSSRLFRSYVAGCEAYAQTCERVEEPIRDGNAPVSVDAAKAQAELKADAEMRANRTRIDLWLDLDRMETKLREMEVKLFFDDEDMRKQAAEEAAPTAARDSWEEKVMKRNK